MDSQTNLWTNAEVWNSVIRTGASLTLLYLCLALVITGMLWGLVQPRFIANIADGIDNICSKVGQFFAWFTLILVIQQVLVVFMQAIFKQSNMSIGPYLPGIGLSPQWFSEELRLYSSLVIVMCAGYTMVEGGHVRVDLIYGGLKHRTKRLIDLIGAWIFLLPFSLLLWYFSWFYMWRSISSTNINLGRDIIKFRAFKLEHSSNPSGFDQIFLFKILIPIFALIMFFQAVSIIFRCVAALRDRDYLKMIGEPKSGH